MTPHTKFRQRITGHRGARRPLVASLLVGLAAVVPLSLAASASGSTPTLPEGVAQGAIKHVWLIILENKSYDATFTGLNDNSYLWQTLPSEGVLLKDYFGTGHSSMDNYISMVSGQAPEEDTQDDCSTNNTEVGPNSNIITTGGSLSANINFGQMFSKGGANAALGSNGCTYPTEVPTLFDQLNAAGVSWKGYAQDLGGSQAIGSTSYQSNTLAGGTDTVPGREDALCGGPGTAANNPVSNPLNLVPSSYPTGISSYTGASLVRGTGSSNNNPQYSDQYVAKHFPFPWFESLTGGYTSGGASTAALTEPATGTNCDANHIANLDDPNDGLVHDLQSSNAPAFSWITPDNCSDAHDTTCKGNNLSGAFTGLTGNSSIGTPNYTPTGLPAYDPEATTPVNFTGGLYASDLFLEYYIPLIEQSTAFQNGGLIDVTFDEGNPPFTYSGNSFNNANAYAITSADVPNKTAGIAADAAGQNIGGVNQNTEPTGPNSTLGTDGSGNQLYPGPGNNSFIDRPPVCVTTSPLNPVDCVPGIVRGGSGTSPGARTDSSATGSASSSTITDPSIVADDTGRMVTGTNIPTITGGVFVGAVSDTGPVIAANSGGATVSGSFQLVDDGGNPVLPTGAVSGIHLSAEGDPANLASGATPDPLWDATDATPGGGDTGAVLISPYITPGSVSTVDYNHYSWLRTIEDLLLSGQTCANPATTLPAGTVCGGLDGLGQVGYAAQPNLTPFGLDVFTNPSGQPPADTPEAPLTLLLPGAGLVLMGGFVAVRRRRGALAS